MQRADTRAALLELARAAQRLAALLDDEPDAPAAVSREPTWRSPTRDLEPVVVAGEEDLVDALNRGHQVLVGPGSGQLVPITWSEEERLRLFALTLAGDVALEAAHAGVQGSRAAVDGMLRRSFDALSEAARGAGLPVPAGEFVAGTARFSELDARSAEWR